MNSNVLITINGIQHDIDEEDSLQTVQQGKYRLVSDKHMIKYEEFIEETEGSSSAVITNLLKIDTNSSTVTLTKKGASSSNMVFQEGFHHKSPYKTPFGTMQMSLFTDKLKIEESESAIDITIHYSLEMNYSHISDCTIKINVKSI